MILCLVVLSRYIVGTKIPEFLALFPSLRYYLVQGAGTGWGPCCRGIPVWCHTTPWSPCSTSWQGAGEMKRKMSLYYKTLGRCERREADYNFTACSVDCKT